MQAVERTVHRLQLEQLIITLQCDRIALLNRRSWASAATLDRREHVVFVKVQMAGCFPEIDMCDVWGVQQLVAILKE